MNIVAKKLICGELDPTFHKDHLGKAPPVQPKMCVLSVTVNIYDKRQRHQSRATQAPKK